MRRAGWGRTSLARGATDPWRIVSPENYRGIITNWQDGEIGVWCKWSSPAEYASVTRMLTNTSDYTDISTVYLIRAIATAPRSTYTRIGRDVFGKLPYRDKSRCEGYRRYFSRRKNAGSRYSSKKNAVHVTPVTSADRCCADVEKLPDWNLFPLYRPALEIYKIRSVISKIENYTRDYTYLETLSSFFFLFEKILVKYFSYFLYTYIKRSSYVENIFSEFPLWLQYT